MPHISVVSPVYKAESCIDALYARLVAVLEPITPDFEIVLVEDHGGDGTWQKIEHLARQDARVKAVQLSRNFGQHHAITAGLDICQGQWVVVMDCDLQDQPEEIPALYAKAQEGYDIVCARRGKRQDAAWKRLSSQMFVRIFNCLSGFAYDPEVANFRIISRPVVDAYSKLEEASRYFPAQLYWLGFHTGYVNVGHAPRHSGQSSYTLLKLVGLAVHSIVAFSNKPLLLFIKLGFTIALLAFAAALYYLCRKVFFGIPIDGWASLMVSLWFIGGAIIGNLGIIGLYLGRIYEECKRRPLYVVGKALNIPAKPKSDQVACPGGKAF